MSTQGVRHPSTHPAEESDNATDQATEQAEAAGARALNGHGAHGAWAALHHALRVLPVAQVVPHEAFHPQRVADLADRLIAEGRLVNPPVAAPLNGKYVVLDGATRLTALQRLGYPHVIVQVVDPAHTPLELHTWHHVVRSGSSDSGSSDSGASAALLDVLRNVPGLVVTPAPVTELHPMPLMPKRLAHLVTPDGHGYRLALDLTQSSTPAHNSHTQRRQRDQALDALNRLVEAYGAWGNVERTQHTDMTTLTQHYRDVAGLVILPHFSVDAILELAVQGRTLPAGLTRFLIPGRILRLNAPLAKLRTDEPQAAKQQWLDALVREKIAYRQVRYYAEPVVLLDE